MHAFHKLHFFHLQSFWQPSVLLLFVNCLTLEMWRCGDSIKLHLGHHGNASSVRFTVYHCHALIKLRAYLHKVSYTN